MTTSAKKTDYNGWTNYETWAVKLWLDNNEGDYQAWQNNIRVFASNDDAYGLSVALKTWHEANTPTVSGVYADLLNGALSEVNWMEIAETLIEEYNS